MSALDVRMVKSPWVLRTISPTDSKRARMPERVDTVRKPQRHCDTKTCKARRTKLGHPFLMSGFSTCRQTPLTLDSRFFNLRRNSASSDAVIRIILSLITIMLANSKSCKVSEESRECTAYVVLLQELRDSAVDPLSTELQTQLAYDQAASDFEQTPISAEKLEQVRHEAGKIGVV